MLLNWGINNMREIKFRAWDKDLNKMDYKIEICIAGKAKQTGNDTILYASAFTSKKIPNIPYA